jgi:hypothetical protein
MAAPERSIAVGAGLVALSLAALVACSQAPQPVKPAPAAPAPAVAPASAPAAETPPPASTTPPAPANAGKPAAGTGPTGVVVIDPGQDESRPKSLVEAARAERVRKAHAGEPTVVITNKTLAHSTGQITYAQPKKGTVQAKAAAGKAGTDVHDEAYWRKRGLDIRVRWRKATEDVDRLEKEAQDLRRQFYAQSDPAVRDAQIKPEWDHTLELLDRARLEVDASKAALDRFMEEGRQGGALPGWLNEGTDQEPEKKPAPPSPTEAVEPPVLKEGAPP